MGRVLGIDPGRARVGLAVSDPTGVVAQPLDVIKVTDRCVEEICQRARELDVERIVVGHPLHLDGREGHAATAAQELATDLRTASGLPVDLWDERLSTVEAERVMRAGGTKAKKQRGRVDKVAASIVLQSYLDAKR